MAKPKVNYVVNLLMLIAFVICAVTGLIMFFFLPSGVRQGRLQEFMGVIKETWITWHNWAGIVLIILVVLHFVLHWKWIVSMTKGFFEKKEKESD